MGGAGDPDSPPIGPSKNANAPARESYDNKDKFKKIFFF